MKLKIKGALLIYNHGFISNASTIMENVNAFGKYSGFKTWAIDTTMGFPSRLADIDFAVVILHYSVLGLPYMLTSDFYKYIKNSSAYKVAFFQDEHSNCQRRFRFINEYKIDCVYTLVEPQYWDKTYRKYTRVKKIKYGIPGYVSDELILLAEKYAKPLNERTIDIGYRGRQLPLYMGMGSQEKNDIAFEFARHAIKTDLVLDFGTKEDQRLYGEKWYHFLGKCKAVIGVEAGASIFDLEDVVQKRYQEYMDNHPSASREEVYNKILVQWEENVPYRTISPRHFEAAAFRICQILYEGNYSGIMKPMVHYIPLRKDFANFDEVIGMFYDEDLRTNICDNAYNDLIASGKYSYRCFVAEFDQCLLEEGIDNSITSPEIDIIKSIMSRYLLNRKIQAIWRGIINRDFPGREYLKRNYRAMSAYLSKQSGFQNPDELNDDKCIDSRKG